jgi:DNA topoisomerase-3
MKLYICEKPSQAKDLYRHVGANTKGDGCFTGDGVTVTWGFGHLLEQSKPDAYIPELKQSWDLSRLPVVPTEWKLDIKLDGKPQFNRIAKLLKQASEVVIATDADREGEVIAREIMTFVGYRGPVRRLWSSATDPASIKKALANLLPGQKTLPLYFSGLGRAHADWLGGMNVTMALTAAFGTGGKGGTVHFGRVQTPVLGLVVRRERAIQNFIPKGHYLLITTFNLAQIVVPMKWLARPELLDKDGHVVDKAKLDAIAARVCNKIGVIDKHETKPDPEPIPLPYYLGGLQKDASNRYGIKPSDVLDACQALYEKHKATTYPRTDCEYLPTSMFADAKEVLAAIVQLDKVLQPLAALANLESRSRAWNDAKVAQSSHHAIIPTAYTGVDLTAMTTVERKVYDMIRRRYLAQFLGVAEYNKTVIEIVCENERFQATGRVLTSPGWRRAYPDVAEKESKPKKGAADQEGDEISALPDIGNQKTSQNLSATVKATKTKPPKRYTQASILTAMESVDKEIEDARLQKIMRNKEKAGIGTDATRAGIVDNLFERTYLALEKKEIVPTEKGSALIALLDKIEPDLADPVLTAMWEDRLKQVEDGQCTLEQFDAEMSAWVSTIVARIKAEAGKPGVQRIGANRDGPAVDCPACGKPMRRIKGPKGFFWGCSGYNDGCKTSLPDDNGKPGERQTTTSANVPKGIAGPVYPCPLCRKPMRQRTGAKGPFWGCTGYPECKQTQPDADGKPGVRPSDVAGKSDFADTHTYQPKPTAKEGKVGDKCPDCKKGLLVAKTMPANGKPFIGCNAFPACRFFKWPGN